MRKTQRRRALSALVVLALLSAACGNSSKSKSAAPDVTSPAPDKGANSADSGKFVPVDAPGVSDKEIRVGGVAAVTNPLGGDYASAFDGAQAYFDMVNASGGIYRRKLVLASKRDDNVANNKSQVEGMLAEDNVFAVLPVATLLFTGADTLVQRKVPTFGWTINPEWQGTPTEPRDNLFGQAGSFLCFGCAASTVPWLAQRSGAHRIGVIAYAVSESAQCADGVVASFDKYGKETNSRVAFIDKSLNFGNTDYSVQVSKMKRAGVDLISACVDTNGVVSLAKEIKKQRLQAVQYLPNAYDHTFLEEFGDLFEGSFVRTDFAQWELEDKPDGLTKYLEWSKKAGYKLTENSMVGWLNADLFVTGLRQAGPDFDRQKLIAAINRMKDYRADGLLSGVDWTKAHTEEGAESCGFLSQIKDSKFVPVFSKPGRPFLCTREQGGKLTARNTK